MAAEVDCAGKIASWRDQHLSAAGLGAGFDGVIDGGRIE